MNTLNINLNKFTANFRIGSFDTDHSGKVKITSICNYIQEIAGMHADDLQWGIEKLQERNLSWVLSRLKLKVFEYPQWKETLTIETWPTGIEGLFGNRDFKILNEEGKVIMIATSSWLVINFKTKRPVRPNEVINNISSNPNELLFEKPLKKLKVQDSNSNEEIIHVHFSDIDINQHVNNVKYIKWIIDSCPKDNLLNMEIDELEVNFLHEAKLDDYLQVSNSNISDEHHFIIKNKSQNIENCKATIKWKVNI
jgi:acyl-ACP thioesterase